MLYLVCNMCFKLVMRLSSYKLTAYGVVSTDSSIKLSVTVSCGKAGFSDNECFLSIYWAELPKLPLNESLFSFPQPKRA